MTDQENPDHWASLASELGAEPPAGHTNESCPPDVGQPEAPARPATPGRKPHRKPAAQSQRPSPDWDRLASELGIAPSEEPATEAVGAPHGPVGFPEEQAEILHGASEPLREPIDLEEETPTRPVEERVWVREDRDEAAEPAEKRSSRRRRKRHRKGRLSREGEARESGARETRVAEAVSQQPAAAPTDEGPETLALPEPERPERRRQRHGSRRRKKSTAHEEAVPPERFAVGDPEEEAFTSLDEELPEDTESTAPQQREAGEKDRSARASRAEEARAGHRAIPTWEEAVGVIVAANLEARAKRPSKTSSRAGNGDRGARNQRGSGRRPAGQGE